MNDMVLYKSLHTIDVDNGKCISRVIPDDFLAFINEYVDYAAKNESVKYYTIKDSQTTVVDCINQIVSGTMAENEENNGSQLDKFSQAISDKLIKEEQQAQAKIQGMGKKIKKGSLVQALIETDDKELLYIIAKVEHTEFYDGESLQKSFGFPSEKKNVWKSAVFPLTYDQEVSFDVVRVYTDNEAKYWAGAFLELNESRNDEVNTKVVFTAIDRELKRRVKKDSERDYWILSNSVYRKMRVRQLLNYNEMIREIFAGYTAENSDLDIESLYNSLLSLPSKNGFDTQFNIIPSALDRKYSLKYQLLPNVELRISGDVEDTGMDIVSLTDELGTRYIKIKCCFDETYNAFNNKH